MPEMATATRLAAIGGMGLQIASPHISLHSTTPGTTGAHEISGGLYTRQPCTLRTAGVSKVNTLPLGFRLPSGVTVAYFGVWNSSGVFLWGGTLASPVVAPAGVTTQLTIPATALVLTIS